MDEKTKKPSEYDMLAQRYRQKLEEELGARLEKQPSSVESREYKEFKLESLPEHVGTYEKACRLAGRMLHLKVAPATEQTLSESIQIAHLDITAADASAFAILLPVATMIFGIIIGLLTASLVFGFFFIILGLVLIPVLNRWPSFLANSWRLKASNQMVLCIFYIVTYMRHTSNLELAVEFAAEHLSPPLSLDLKKVLWDVETEKFDSIKDSLEDYLHGWRKWNMEFVESIHLVESSLFETSEERRLGLLDKALDVMLTETYEKMLHYAHNLKSPITTLHMLGIILPVLGLVIMPLVVSFIGGVSWYHIMLLYDVVLPIVVYYLGKNILSSRPTGYGDTDYPLAQERKKQGYEMKIGKTSILVSPALAGIIVGGIVFLIGLSPIIVHALSPDFDVTLIKGITFLDYRESISPETAGQIIGPYGLGAAALSLAIPLAFGLGLGLYFKMKTAGLLGIRENAKKLEQEFAAALFQLGNRLGDGLPAEIAIPKVAEVMEGTASGHFFELVTINIRKLGMGLKDAIFNPRTGALTVFPSTVIESSMKVLTESIRKGPVIAAQALTNVSRYIKEIHAVNERLRDLMADIISDMKSQIVFLTPAISGIVIGITSMITTILGALSGQVTKISNAGEGAASLGGAGFLSLFGDGIPTYFFQIVVGLYVVEIIYILTVLSNGIENGADSLSEKDRLGKNLVHSTLLYCLVSLTVMVVFNLIASRILTVTVS